MVMISFGVGLAGVVSAGAGLVAAWFSVPRLRLWSAIRRSAVRGPGEVEPGLCLVAGVAAPGAGELRSTVNGDVCVWHRHVGRRTRVRTRVDPQGRSRRSTR